MTNAKLLQQVDDLDQDDFSVMQEWITLAQRLADALESTEKRLNLADAKARELKARLAKAEKSLADADFHECRACGDWKEIRQMASPGVCLQCFWKESTS